MAVGYQVFDRSALGCVAAANLSKDMLADDKKAGGFDAKKSEVMSKYKPAFETLVKEGFDKDKAVLALFN